MKKRHFFFACMIVVKGFALSISPIDLDIPVQKGTGVLYPYQRCKFSKGNCDINKDP